PEFFSVIVFGLASVSALGAALGASIPTALLSLMIGLLFATVGVDGIYGANRFTFGLSFLGGGIDFIPVMIGLYAIGEVLARVREGVLNIKQRAPGGLVLPPLREVAKRWATFVRGTAVGTLIGALPGAGATVASFVSYGIEKQYGKAGHQLGSGVPEGLAVSQTAATASVGGAIIPLLTLGIPGSAADAVILGALQLHNVDPGPMVFQSQPNLIYPIFASVYVALAITVVVILASLRAMVSILRVPPALLVSFILILSLIGAYTERSDLGDVWIAVLCGILGYVLSRLHFPTAPLLLGVILGHLAESNFVETMISYHNDWAVFFTRPVSALFLVLAALSFALPLIKGVGKGATARLLPESGD
ncbi:MAG: tripartite tricarboxylate transporter permease, partial [bacterium]|nr:tripartite tricarboxylate transporter permease [bacterium]